MAFETITMAMLTHPIQAMFAVVVLFQALKPVLHKLTAPKVVARPIRATA